MSRLSNNVAFKQSFVIPPGNLEGVISTLMKTDKQIMGAVNGMGLTGEEILSNIQTALTEHQPINTEGSKHGSPRKSKHAWKREFASAYKSGKFANHRTSRLLHEAKVDLIP